MLIKSTKDWKQFLAPEDEEKLNQLLKIVGKYRSAYRTADDVKVAQLWAALLDLKKENDRLNARLADIEDVMQAVYERMKRKESEKDELIKSLERF